MIAEQILKQYPHTTTNASPEQVLRLLSELEGIIEKDIEGDVVELGCCAGLTSVYIQRLLDAMKCQKLFHAYDSFEGLPEKVEQDEAVGPQADIFQKGHFDLKGTWQIKNRFETSGLILPILHEGWFKDQEYPEKISFGFLDGDFYDSITDSLTKVWPAVQYGGVICLHDYGWDQLPGVKTAVKDFFGTTDLVDDSTYGLGVIKK